MNDDLDAQEDSIDAFAAGEPPLRPVDWWRRPCLVTDRIAVCGDLPPDAEDAAIQLRAWQDAGITAIVDVREEWSDEDRVAGFAPGLRYVWLGTHDDGGEQDDAWFRNGVDSVLDLLDADPAARVVIHCHMGINRAPSLAFAVLLALGFDAIDALETIRARRPIAAILYAESAVDWWLRREGATPRQIRRERVRVRNWLLENAADVAVFVPLAESERRLETDAAYAERILRRYRPELPAEHVDTLVARLVRGYPSHWFVIDLEECADIGLPARPGAGDEIVRLERFADACRRLERGAAILGITPPEASGNGAGATPAPEIGDVGDALEVAIVG